MNKHAYLIIAHNEFYILERLLKLIDYEQNDIYLHIDKKVKDFNFDYYKNIVKKGNIYFVNRMNVHWSGYSQIECEYLLLESAIKKNYSYYHLLSGVDMPLKSADEIYSFFEKNNGYEFLTFCQPVNEERIKYYHLFIKNIRQNRIRGFLHNRLVGLQKSLHFNRLKHAKFQVAKGANWFSITHDLAKYIISKKEFVKSHFRFSSCADELFIQTLVYNSPFIDKVYNKGEKEYDKLMRYIDWKRGEPYTFTINEYDELMNSGMLFARKFSTTTLEKKEIVDKIYQELGDRND